MSIIKHIIAIFIDISAILKIGKSIGTNSMKSMTYPLNSLSRPLPIVPPKRKESPIKFQ